MPALASFYHPGRASEEDARAESHTSVLTPVTMATVEVHVYDLSNGLARVMSQSVVGKQVDIIPHTGVVVDWGGGKKLEYFFGGGICVTAAGKSVPMAAWAD